MEGQASGSPDGGPGRRALGAMESAARRAREATGMPPAQSSAQPAAPAGREVHDRERARERWLVGSVITVAALVVAASVGLAVSLTGGVGPNPAPSTVAAPGQTSRPTPTGHGGVGSAGGHSATSTTTTSSSVPPTPGGAPVISGLAPSSGPAGQGIQVSGGNFLSSSGQIVATFNGQVAHTSCPAQNTCTVTAPSLPGSSSAQVVITTSAGTSNPVTFTYS